MGSLTVKLSVQSAEDKDSITTCLRVIHYSYCITVQLFKLSRHSKPEVSYANPDP